VVIEEPGNETKSDRRTPQRYAFGDLEEAALRLQLVDRVFAEPSRSIVDTARRHRIRLAVDLGCGPGFTTHRLAQRLRPGRLVGMDTSRPFLERAATFMPLTEWLLHDVTHVPFPTAPADVLHARFVLSHLAEPESVLRSWLGQLNVGGHLLVQEDEEIVAEHPALITYEEMARSLVAHRGGDLWVGDRLARTELPYGYETLVNRVYAHRVPTSLAAEMFSMNFAVWRHDPFIVQTYPASLLQDLATDLLRLAHTDHDDHEGDVVFKLRQLALRRVHDVPE
jgi:ubiquinone/menaquinone biosynthesis C-methylase UbiE